MGEWREPSGTGTGTYKVAMARLEPDGVRAKRWRAGGVRVSQLVSQISVLARSEIIRDGAFHQGRVARCKREQDGSNERCYDIRHSRRARRKIGPKWVANGSPLSQTFASTRF